MDVAVIRGRAVVAVGLLRPWSVAGFVLGAVCGALLFVTQATDYVRSPWFLAKMGVLAVAVMNAAVHFRLDRFPQRQPRQAAIASLVLWPVVLVLGRMIAYGEGRSARTARTLASGGHPAFTDQVTGPMCRRGGGIPQERCGMPTGSTD